MKLGITFSLGFALLVLATASFADTTTVRFGGTGGNTYRPATLSCHVGDTVVFAGDFDTHPLKSDAVPSGASSFEHLSGKAPFSYIVTMLGNYTYHCENHGGPGTGMHGVFTAVELGVGDSPEPKTIILSQNYPNPVKSTTTIDFQLESAAKVILKVFTSDGKEITTLVNSIQSEGHHSVPFDALHLAPGVYFYRLEIGGETLTRQLVVTK